MIKAKLEGGMVRYSEYRIFMMVIGLLEAERKGGLSLGWACSITFPQSRRHEGQRFIGLLLGWLTERSHV